MCIFVQMDYCALDLPHECIQAGNVAGNLPRGTRGSEPPFASISTCSGFQSAEPATASLKHCLACWNRSVLLLSFVRIALTFFETVSTRHNLSLKELS